jgi:hypothetical protein
MGKTEKQNYDKLAKALETIVESGHIDTRRVYKVSFWRGVFFGLGGVIGGTLVVAIALYILSLFTDIPFIGDVADTVRDSLEE